jgi:hypothetical protein
MLNYLDYLLEILLVVVLPLLVLYLKGNWPVRKILPSLLFIPILWYFTYAPLHELGHGCNRRLDLGTSDIEQIAENIRLCCC